MGTTFFIPKGRTDLALSSITDDGLVIFNEGDQTVSQGNNLSALASGLSGLYFGKNSRVNIPAQNALRADVDNATTITPKVLFEQMAGLVWLYPGGNNNLMTRVNHLGAGTLGFMSGGTVTTYEQRNGRGMFTGDVVLTNLRKGGGLLDLLYHATPMTDVRMNGGVLNSARSCTTGRFRGDAIATFQLADSTTAALPTATTLELSDRAKVKWRFGNITNLYLEGDAVFDPSENPADFMITNLFIDSTAYRNPENKRLLGTQFGVTISNTTIWYDEAQ